VLAKVDISRQEDVERLFSIAAGQLGMVALTTGLAKELAADQIRGRR
jgi:hypothetical protein